MFRASCRAASSALAEGDPQRARDLAARAGILKPGDSVVNDLLDAAARTMRRDRESAPSPPLGPASWSAGAPFAGTPRRTTATMCSAFSLTLHAVAGALVVGLVARAGPVALEPPPDIRPYQLQSITFVMPPPAGSDGPPVTPTEPPPDEGPPAPEELPPPALQEPLPEPSPPVVPDALAAATLDVVTTPALPGLQRPSLPLLGTEEPQVLSAAAVAPVSSLPGIARPSLPFLGTQEPQVLSAAAVAPTSVGQYGLSVGGGLRLAQLLSPPRGYWEVSEIDREPILERYVRPTYPDEAVEREVEGEVTVQVSISYTGHVERVRIVTGVPELNEAALEAARQFVFSPAIKRGFAVPAVMTMAITFNLNSLR